MVWVTMMAECQRGDHETCPGGESAAPGEIGGVICECTCHHVKAEPSEQEQELFWHVIEDSREAVDFERYIEHYPNGVYTESAKRRLAKLNEAEPKASDGMPDSP